MKADLTIQDGELLITIECDDAERLHVIESNTSLPCDVVPLGNNHYQYVMSVNTDIPNLVIELLNYGVEWSL